MFEAIFMCFVRVLGVCVQGGGGLFSKGSVHNPLMQFFTFGSSKIKVSATYFFDILTTHNDHPSYVKLFLGNIHFWLGGGALIAVV